MRFFAIAQNDKKLELFVKSKSTVILNEVKNLFCYIKPTLFSSNFSLQLADLMLNTHSMPTHTFHLHPAQYVPQQYVQYAL